MTSLSLSPSEAEELVHLLATVASDVEYAEPDEIRSAKMFIERIEAMSSDTEATR